MSANLAESSLLPSRQEAAQELLRRQDASQSLLAFTKYTTPKWTDGKIHREICVQAERVVRGEIDRLMLLCPPQHGKSQIISRRLPAFMLGLDPSRDVIAASATADLAEGFGRDVRNCISSQECQNVFPDLMLAEDSQAKGRWNTRQGGAYVAIGVGGQLYGKGGMAIIDDPFGSWDDAQSELQREKVWDWYQGTLYNRIRPGQPIIVIQHRMHEDDLAGRLIAKQAQGGDKWEIVNLPALIEDPPWVERYDSIALKRIKANTAARQWSALYLQNPAPDEGTFFKREWFRRYRPEQLPKAMHRYLSSDHAPAGMEDSDFNCMRVWGLSGKDLYMLDGFRHQSTIDVAMERVVGNKDEKKVGLIQKHKPLCWFPEDDNNWKSVAGFVTKEMRRQSVFCRIEPISPHGNDKIVKAQAFQGMASMGCVWIPEGTEGDEVIEQYVRFPGSKHDDEVDAAAVIGRAIDEAHPAILAPPVDKPKPRGDYDSHTQEDDSWKVA